MTTVAELVGTALARLGVGHAFGVVGSGNFHVIGSSESLLKLNVLFCR